MDRKCEGITELVSGNPWVRVFMGKQKAPKPGLRIRRSRFVHRLVLEGQVLLFHTLTRQILLAEPELIGWFVGDRTYPPEILGKEDAQFFWENWFLVPETERESRTWAEIRHLLEVKENIPDGISHYTIITTTACNARCVYCYEHGMKRMPMPPETVEETIRFIRDHRPEQGMIHLHWYGGEPTCAPENMDRISAGLAEAGIGFSAEMTSNGSLFSPEMVRRAKEIWRVEKVQVTLDGLAEEYAARKRYASSVNAPFETVTGNIRNLLVAGIETVIRLNVDADNVGEIYRTAKFLKEYYTEEERKRITVYAHSLFRTPEKEAGICLCGTDSDELEEAVLHINEYLIQTGLQKKDPGELLKLKTHACKAAAPEHSAVISAEGKLFACDAMPESMRYGDVRNGADPALWEKISRPCDLDLRCETCAFLPQCTEFSRCPIRPSPDVCRQQEKRKLESDLRMMYFFCRSEWEKEKRKS